MLRPLILASAPDYGAARIGSARRCQATEELATQRRFRGPVQCHAGLIDTNMDI